MSTAANKATVRRFWEEVVNKGNLAIVDEIIAPHYVNHDPSNPHPVTGPDGLRQLVTAYRTAFPDFRITIEELIAEGKCVVTRWIVQGTQTGELPGLPPSTGKQMAVKGITIDHFEDGKIVESWNSSDTLGMMQQLGALPALTQAGH